MIFMFSTTVIVTDGAPIYLNTVEPLNTDTLINGHLQ
jgi:hypothetical protein